MDRIYKIDMVLIIVSVFVLIGIVGYMRPMVIAPLDDYQTSESEVLFSIDNAEVLLIDDNIDFSTPEEYYVKDGLKLSLVPGEYYWKAVGVVSSEIRTLTINSEVDLEFRKIIGDGFDVVNVGNVKLNVDVYDGDELIEKKKLGVSDSLNSSGTMVVGGQDE